MHAARLVVWRASDRERFDDDRRADQHVLYIMQILTSLMMVAMVFVMITMAKASAERVAELLSEKPDLHNPAQPVCEVKDGSIGL